MSKVILVSGNAGQGKTTVAVNLACALRSFGCDVLLVDGDMRTPKVGFHFGMPLIDRSVQDVLLGRRSLADAVFRAPSGLKILFSSLAEIDSKHPSSLLPELQKFAEVIVVDVPSRDKHWCAKGETVLVLHPDFPSVMDAVKLSKMSKISGVVMNRVHSDGVELSHANVEQLLSPVIGVLAEESGMRESLRRGFPFVDFHPELSVPFKKLAARLMNVEYSSPLRRPLWSKLVP